MYSTRSKKSRFVDTLWLATSSDFRNQILISHHSRGTPTLWVQIRSIAPSQHGWPRRIVEMPLWYYRYRILWPRKTYWSNSMELLTMRTILFLTCCFVKWITAHWNLNRTLEFLSVFVESSSIIRFFEVSSSFVAHSDETLDGDITMPPPRAFSSLIKLLWSLPRFIKWVPYNNVFIR